MFFFSSLLNIQLEVFSVVWIDSLFLLFPGYSGTGLILFIFLSSYLLFTRRSWFPSVISTVCVLIIYWAPSTGAAVRVSAIKRSVSLSVSKKLPRLPKGNSRTAGDWLALEGAHPETYEVKKEAPGYSATISQPVKEAELMQRTYEACLIYEIVKKGKVK